MKPVQKGPPQWSGPFVGLASYAKTKTIHTKGAKGALGASLSFPFARWRDLLCSRFARSTIILARNFALLNTFLQYKLSDAYPVKFFRICSTSLTFRTLPCETIFSLTIKTGMPIAPYDITCFMSEMYSISGSISRFMAACLVFFRSLLQLLHPLPNTLIV